MMRTIFTVDVSVQHSVPLTEEDKEHIIGNLRHSAETSGICVGEKFDVALVFEGKKTALFGSLPAGQKFGFLESSDIDDGFEKTGAVMLKTNAWWPSDMYNASEIVWDNFSNAICITEGMTFTNPAVVEPYEEVLVLE